MADPRGIEPGDQVRQSSKPLSHLVKIDKAGALRTMCGVPIRPGRGWTQATGDLGCPTCLAASTKRPSGGPPVARSTISYQQAECVYEGHGVRRASPTGRHIRNVLAFHYDGTPQPPYCTWCGVTLEPEPHEHSVPAAGQSDLVPAATEC